MSIVSDKPILIAQRPISSWGDASMHIFLLVELPATIVALIVSEVLDESAVLPSLVESYITAAILIVGSTLQWLVLGKLVETIAHRIARPASTT